MLITRDDDELLRTLLQQGPVTMPMKQRSAAVSSPVEVSSSASLESLVTMPQNTEVVTTLLDTELCRTLAALRRYQGDPGQGSLDTSTNHAALHRATMDLSKMLSRWRHVPASDRNPGQPK